MKLQNHCLRCGTHWKNVRLYGKRFSVLKKKEGAGLFGDSNDTTAYIPVNFASIVWR
jgi:hypothetical protein